MDTRIIVLCLACCALTAPACASRPARDRAISSASSTESYVPVARWTCGSSDGLVEQALHLAGVADYEVTGKRMTCYVWVPESDVSRARKALRRARDRSGGDIEIEGITPVRH